MYGDMFDDAQHFECGVLVFRQRHLNLFATSNALRHLWLNRRVLCSIVSAPDHKPALPPDLATAAVDPNLNMAENELSQWHRACVLVERQLVRRCADFQLSLQSIDAFNPDRLRRIA